MTKRPIHVWAIIHTYYPLFSGAAIQAQRLYSALSNQDLQFTVLTGRHSKTIEHPEMEVKEKVRIWRLPLLLGIPFKARIFERTWKLLNDVWFVIVCLVFVIRHRSEIDVLHFHGLYGLIGILLPLSKLLGIPTLVKLTKQKYLNIPTGASLPHRLYGALKKKSITKADMIIVLSNVMHDECIELGLDAGRLITIPQGIDFSQFHLVTEKERMILRRRLGLDKKQFYIAFVGSIIHRKGVDILTDAYIRIASDWPQVNLILVGKHTFYSYAGEKKANDILDEYSKALYSLIKQHGLKDRVIWTGELAPEEVKNYLQAADVFCFPSRREGVPSVLLEAMACGLPLIVSPLDGTSQTLLTHGKHGFITSNNHVDEYVKYIEIFLKEKTLITRMGRDASCMVNKSFSFDRVTNDYHKLYQKVSNTFAKTSG